MYMRKPTRAFPRTQKISLLNRAENLVAEQRQEQGDQLHQEGTTQYGQLQALDIQDSQDEKQRRAKTESK